MERVVTFDEFMDKYMSYYGTKETSFRYKDETELEEIFMEVFDLDEDAFNVEPDYDNEIFTVYEKNIVYGKYKRYLYY